ncbi:MAG: hypothetical protein WCG04_04470 [Alphaproteobacteria bacterium]
MQLFCQLLICLTINTFFLPSLQAADDGQYEHKERGHLSVTVTPQAAMLIGGFISPIAGQLLDHRALVIPYTRAIRREFFEERAAPTFYRVEYNGCPLNVFIFPTVHDLPLEVIPPYILDQIKEIADTEGSQFFCELERKLKIGEFTEFLLSNNVLKNLLQLDIEVAIEREIAFTKQWFNNNVKDADEYTLRFWNQHFEKLALDARSKYSSWPAELDPLVRSQIENLGGLNQGELNKLDPCMLYDYLLEVKRSNADEIYFTTYTTPTLILDYAIRNIFEAAKRKIGFLETANEQSMAILSVIWEKLKTQKKERTSDFQRTLLEINKFIKANPLRGAPKIPKPSILHIPLLDEVELEEPYIMSYLEGGLLENCFDGQEGEDIAREVEIRNQKWWTNTIHPLLSSRTQQDNPEQTPPILLTYGAGHNCGPASIARSIANLPWFTLRLLTRTGWQGKSCADTSAIPES